MNLVWEFLGVVQFYIGSFRLKDFIFKNVFYVSQRLKLGQGCEDSIFVWCFYKSGDLELGVFMDSFYFLEIIYKCFIFRILKG